MCLVPKKGDFKYFFADFTRQFVSSIFGNTPTCLPDISLNNKFVVNIIVTGISNIYFSQIWGKFSAKFDSGRKHVLLHKTTSGTPNKNNFYNQRIICVN